MLGLPRPTVKRHLPPVSLWRRKRNPCPSAVAPRAAGVPATARDKGLVRAEEALGLWAEDKQKTCSMDSAVFPGRH